MDALEELAELQELIRHEKQLECQRSQGFEKASDIAKDAYPFNQTDCGIAWDEIMCWPPAKAGTYQSQPCPGYIMGFNMESVATRYCQLDGQWYFQTNYSECYSSSETTVLVSTAVNETDFWALQEIIPIIRNISHGGYGLSLVSLIIAFLIVASFKKLRCPRNMLHLHLFASFIMRAFMGFLKTSLFEQGVGLRSNFVAKNGKDYFKEEEGNWECKAVTTLWQYFIMANYSWILMEGLYIHNLIMWALSADGSSIIVYVILGWGLPLIFVSLWAVARIFLDNTYCWTVKENSIPFYLILIPTDISIFINFGLFVNIVRLLMGKVRTSIIEERKRYWRLAKSTLVLVVLFGVPHFIFLTMYFGNAWLDMAWFEVVWLLCDQMFASCQGFIVALLYCYLNEEVQEEIKSKWRRLTYNDRVVDNNLPSSSCTSWSSSSYSMPRNSYNIYMLCLICGNKLKSKKSANFRSASRSGTVDCIVCETCPAFHENVKNSGCGEPAALCPEVEMKLMGGEHSHNT